MRLHRTAYRIDEHCYAVVLPRYCGWRVSVTSHQRGNGICREPLPRCVPGLRLALCSSVDNVDLATSAATASASLSVSRCGIAQVSAGELTSVLFRTVSSQLFPACRSPLRTLRLQGHASRMLTFASETANLTKSQILTQAGISVLAQANAQPQQVLALLQ